MDPPPYILSLQNSIRARPISWEGAVRAKTITENDLKQIKSIDKVRREQRKQTVEDDPEAYSGLLLGRQDSVSILQAAAKRTDIVQYILVLTGDLIDGQCERRIKLGGRAVQWSNTDSIQISQFLSRRY